MHPASSSLLGGDDVDREAALRILAAAFNDDPLIVGLFPGPQRHERSRPFFNFLLEKSRLWDELLLGIEADGRLAGVASVERPGRGRLGVKQMLRFALACLRLLRGIGPRSFLLLNSYMRATLRARPTQPHHYLVFIAVDPAAQGRGFGQQLLEGVHSAAEQDGRSCGVALDTEQPRNVPLYERFGYQLTETTQAGPVRIFCMLKDKRAASSIGG